MKPTLGQLIQRRRNELELTQEELAERVGDGMRQSDISRLEHDKIVLPRRGRLERIATALELPIGVLLVQSGWMGAAPDEDGSIEGEDLAPTAMSTDLHDMRELRDNVATVAVSLPTLKKTMREVQDLVETAESALNEAQAKIADAVDIAL